MAEEKRAATDILLSIEQKIDKVLTFMQNLDNNVKMVLNRLNSLESRSSEPRVIEAQQKYVNSPAVGAPSISDPESETTNKSNVLVAKAPVPPKRLEKIGDGVEKKVSVDTAEKPRKEVKKTVNASKVISVSQKISYPSGLDVAFAIVEIYDGNDLILSTKTNTSGKWIKPLPVGNYAVKVTKKSSGELQPAVNLRYNISIPDSSSAMELSSPEFK